MKNLLLNSLADKLISYCEKRNKVLKITGNAGPDDVYLVRHVLARNKYFSIYIHQFLRSDRDDLHDHPWHFATFLVRGAYTERKWNPSTEQVESTRRTTSQNRFVVRKATDQHQVVVDKDLTLEEKGEAALTFFIGGPVTREWGFIKEDTLPEEFTKRLLPWERQDYKFRKWVPWRKYLGLPDDHPSR